MQIKTTGLILRQRPIGEYDAIVTILTKDYGLIDATANGVKRIKSSLAGGLQLLVFAEVCLYKGKKYYSVNSAVTQRSFYDLRLDVEKLALASYFCELTRVLVPEGEQHTWVFLRLLLNTLAFLETGERALLQLKALYELRLLSLAGFMPDLVACRICGTFEDEKMVFDPLTATLSCGACHGEGDVVSPAVLRGMRHIVYADDAKLFSFKLTGDSLWQLCQVVEHYLTVHVERRFKSLSMFWQLHQTLHTTQEGQQE